MKITCTQCVRYFRLWEWCVKAVMKKLLPYHKDFLTLAGTRYSTHHAWRAAPAHYWLPPHWITPLIRLCETGTPRSKGALLSLYINKYIFFVRCYVRQSKTKKLLHSQEGISNFIKISLKQHDKPTSYLFRP